MKVKRALILGLPLIVPCLFLTVRRGFPEPSGDRIVRIAELEIYPDQVNAYKAALKEEIDVSIRTEPGVFTLYAISVKGLPSRFDFSRHIAIVLHTKRICSLLTSRNTKNRYRKW